MLVLYELKKIWGYRGFAVFVVLMLIANFCVIQYIVHSEGVDSSEATVEYFFDWYHENTSEFLEAFEDVKHNIDSREKVYLEQIKQGNFEYELPPLQNRYATGGYTDQQLFGIVLNSVNTVELFPKSIQEIVDKAEHSIHHNRVNGVFDNTFTIRYQKRLIECYSKVGSNVELEVGYVRGWDGYFSYGVVDLFVCIVTAVMASVMYTLEGHSGFITIMRTCYCGRKLTAFAKMLAGFISVGVVLIVFTVETWSVYFLYYGFSNSSSAVQILEQFRRCPYILTVGQAFMLGLLIKLFVLYAFYLLILRISMWIGHCIGAFVVSIVIVGGNVWIEQIDYLNINSYGRVFNLFSAMSENILFSRYIGVNLWEYSIDAPLAIFIFYIVIIVICFNSILTDCTVYSPRNLRRLRNKVKGYIDKLSDARTYRKVPKKVHYKSLIIWEAYKLFNAKKIVILLLLLLFKEYISNDLYMQKQSYADAIYEEYMTTLSGEMTYQKRLYINKERDRINVAMAEFPVIQDKYFNDEIEYEEYRIGLMEYDYAYTHDGVLEMIEKHADYLDELARKNVNAWFVYDTGWKTLYMQPFDWSLFGAIMILLAEIIACEYQQRSSVGGTYQIIKCSLKGRYDTFKNKYVVCVCSAVVLFLIWNAVDLFNIITHYDFPAMNAPACSIQILHDFTEDITIGNYIILYYFTRFIAIVLLASLVCFLSAITRSTLGCIGITVILTTLPKALVTLGVDTMQYIDFTGFLQGTPILLLNDKGVLFIIINIIFTCVMGIMGGSYWICK